MTNSLYLSSTYLKLLRSNPELMGLLRSSIGDDLDRLINDDYLYGEDIFNVFNIAAKAGINSWLLHFGLKISVASHGPLGFAVLSAPDLHTAMNTLIDYTPIRTSAYEAEFRHNGSRIELVYTELTGQDIIGQWLIESGIHVAQSLIETVMSHPLGDNAIISFSYPEPSYAQELKQFYNVECVFNAKENILSIPASWCRISSPLSDPETFASNLQKCRDLKLQLSSNDNAVQLVTLELNRFFEQRRTGQTLDENLPSLASLAEKQHCSTRTFSRKLSEQSQSYKLMLDKIRQSHAIDLLRNTHTTVADIALILDYQEPANFIRAFKNWFNITPAAWRKRPTPNKNNYNTINHDEVS